MVHFCEHRKVHVDAQKIHGCTCTCISIACWVYCCSIPSCCRALCIKVIFLVFLPGRLQTVLNLFEYVNGECLDAQSATNIIFNSCLTSEDEVVSVPWTIKHNSNNMSVFQNISWRTVMLIVTSSVHIRTTQCVSSLALYSITLILLMTTVMFKPVSALRCCWKQEHVTTRLFIAIDSMTTLVPT